MSVIRSFARPVLALPLVVLGTLAGAPAAHADVVAVAVTPATVGRGDTLTVRFQPTGGPDDAVFHQASFSVLRPGRACPTTDDVPEEDRVAGGNSGPFRATDPPIDVAVEVPDDAPDGTYAVCTWTAEVALSLVGEPLPGPSSAVEIRGGVPLAGGDPDPDAGSSPGTPGAGSGPGGGGSGATRRPCTISPGTLRRARVSSRLQIRCRGVRGRIRIRFTRPRGTVSYQLRTLRHGRATVRVGQLPAGRSHVAVLRGDRVVGERAIRVR